MVTFDLLPTYPKSDCITGFFPDFSSFSFSLFLLFFPSFLAEPVQTGSDPVQLGPVRFGFGPVQAGSTGSTLRWSCRRRPAGSPVDFGAVRLVVAWAP